MNLIVQSMQARHGNTTTLDIENWSVPVGRTAVLGLNGAGKTTLLRGLVGTPGHFEGKLLVNGEDSPPTLAALRRATGYLPQDAAFPGNFTVREFLTYIGWLRGLSSREATSRGSALAERLSIDQFLHRQLSKLSGGELQRVALAQVLIHEPKMLLLDEFTAGLDVQQRAIINEFLAVHASPERLIFTTHHLDDVASLAQHVVVLHRGKIVLSETVEHFASLAGVPDHGQQDLETALLAVLRSDGPSSRND